MFYLPLTTNPLGWVILGVSGYALYQAGKRRGLEDSAASRIVEPPAEIELTQQQEKTSSKGEK